MVKFLRSLQSCVENPWHYTVGLCTLADLQNGNYPKIAFRHHARPYHFACKKAGGDYAFDDEGCFFVILSATSEAFMPPTRGTKSTTYARHILIHYPMSGAKVVELGTYAPAPAALR